jgi:prolipoprotein diacylglyceryltransferase
MFVVAFDWVGIMKKYDREDESIEKLDHLFIWTVLATLLGARLDMFFYDWEYFRNHLLEIFLPVLHQHLNLLDIKD